MKLFELLFQRKNSEEKKLELRLDRSHLIDRSKVDSDAIDRMQRVPASEAYCNYIYKNTIVIIRKNLSYQKTEKYILTG